MSEEATDTGQIQIEISGPPGEFDRMFEAIQAYARDFHVLAVWQPGDVLNKDEQIFKLMLLGTCADTERFARDILKALPDSKKALAALEKSTWIDEGSIEAVVTTWTGRLQTFLHRLFLKGPKFHGPKS